MIRRGGRIVIFIVIFLAVVLPLSTEAFTGNAPSLRRNFVLRGDLTLSYEGDWGEVEKRNRFTQRYHLILEGFVKDPRLAYFELEGSFTERTNEPGNRNEYRFGGNIFLLNKRALRGPLQYFPQPIQLRFDYLKSDTAKYYSYGLSLIYNLPGRNLAFFQEGKVVSLVRGRLGTPGIPVRTENGGEEDNSADNNGGNNEEGNNNGNRVRPRGGLLLPFPTFYLDYDTSKNNTSSGIELKTDRLDFRAESIMEHSQYRFEYRFSKTNFMSLSYTDQTVDLRADYQFPEKSTARTFDIWNRLFYRKTDNTDYTNLSSNGVWLRRLGQDLQDTILVGGGARYFTSDISSGYEGDISSTYRQKISERLSNIATATLGYNSAVNKKLSSLTLTTDENTYKWSMSDDLTYQLSRRVLLRSGLFVGDSNSGLVAGDSNSGLDYRGGLGVSTNTRIAVSADYWFGHSGEGDRENDSQRFNINMSTRLFSSVYLASRNYYLIQNFVNGDRQRSLYLHGDVYWNISRYRFQLGANYKSLKETGSSINDTATTTLRASLSTSFRKRLFLFARIDYSHDNTGLSYLEVGPSLSWAYRQMYLTAWYTVKRTTRSGSNPSTEQRLYFTLRRDFGLNLRPFF